MQKKIDAVRAKKNVSCLGKLRWWRKKCLGIRQPLVNVAAAHSSGTNTTNELGQKIVQPL